MIEKKYLHIKETSEFIGLSVATINRLIKEKKIPSYLIAGRRLFDKDELIEWVKSQKEDLNK